MSANKYTAASGKRAFGFSPLPEISGISIVMYVSELFVDGNCVIGSLVRRTFARGRYLLFMLFKLSAICLSRKSADFNAVFWIFILKRNSSSSPFIR